MLTIKHITLSGIENIYQAFDVSFAPAEVPEGQSVRSKHGGGTLMFMSPTRHAEGTSVFQQINLSGGTVFVMNDHGKTVSRYDLGASDVPHGVDPHTLHSPYPETGEKVPG